MMPIPIGRGPGTDSTLERCHANIGRPWPIGLQNTLDFHWRLVCDSYPLTDHCADLGLELVMPTTSTNPGKARRNGNNTKHARRSSSQSYV